MSFSRVSAFITLERSEFFGGRGGLSFHDMEGSQFFGVWLLAIRRGLSFSRSEVLAISFRSNMTAPHVIRQQWENGSDPKKENLRHPSLYGLLAVLHRLDSENRVLFTNLFINLSLVMIILKPRYWKCGKNLYFGQISDFFVRFRRFRGFRRFRRFRGCAVCSSTD